MYYLPRREVMYNCGAYLGMIGQGYTFKLLPWLGPWFQQKDGNTEIINLEFAKIGR
jgi:hypothetical protein